MDLSTICGSFRVEIKAKATNNELFGVRINRIHRSSEARTPPNHLGLDVIVINQTRGLDTIYKSRDTRAKPKCQGFMNRIQAERWFITIL